MLESLDPLLSHVLLGSRIRSIAGDKLPDLLLLLSLDKGNNFLKFFIYLIAKGDCFQ